MQKNWCEGMDIELARTFLAIVETRSFMKAADLLHVSQTAVSARVKTLETQLGRPLFVRNRGGVTLTAAGRQFLDYAPSFVRLWQRARQQVAVPEGHRAVLAVGVEASMWSPWLTQWVIRMRATAPDVALRLRFGWRDELTDAVAEGLIDLSVVYAPTLRPGLAAEVLLEETLVLVQREGERGAPYIHVEWGEQIARSTEPVAGGEQAATLAINFGPAALSVLLATGGKGYFRRSVVDPHLRSGEVSLVSGAPEQPYPVYAVYAGDAGPEVKVALEGLRQELAPGG